MWRPARPGFPVSAGTNRGWGIRWPPVPVPGAETTTESLKPAVAAGMTTDAFRPLAPQAGAGRQRPCHNPGDRSNQ
jgi:hypothetical protein